MNTSFPVLNPCELPTLGGRVFRLWVANTLCKHAPPGVLCRPRPRRKDWIVVDICHRSSERSGLVYYGPPRWAISATQDAVAVSAIRQSIGCDAALHFREGHGTVRRAVCICDGIFVVRHSAAYTGENRAWRAGRSKLLAYLHINDDT